MSSSINNPFANSNPPPVQQSEAPNVAAGQPNKPMKRAELRKLREAEDAKTAQENSQESTSQEQAEVQAQADRIRQAREAEEANKATSPQKAPISTPPEKPSKKEAKQLAKQAKDQAKNDARKQKEADRAEARAAANRLKEQKKKNQPAKESTLEEEPVKQSDLIPETEENRVTADVVTSSVMNVPPKLQQQPTSTPESTVVDVPEPEILFGDDEEDDVDFSEFGNFETHSIVEEVDPVRVLPGNRDREGYVRPSRRVSGGNDPVARIEATDEPETLASDNDETGDIDISSFIDEEDDPQRTTAFSPKQNLRSTTFSQSTEHTVSYDDSVDDSISLDDESGRLSLAQTSQKFKKDKKSRRANSLSEMASLQADASAAQKINEKFAQRNTKKEKSRKTLNTAGFIFSKIMLPVVALGMLVFGSITGYAHLQTMGASEPEVLSGKVVGITEITGADGACQIDYQYQNDGKFYQSSFTIGESCNMGTFALDAAVPVYVYGADHITTVKIDTNAAEKSFYISAGIGVGGLLLAVALAVFSKVRSRNTPSQVKAGNSSLTNTES